jgi:hypothetical protein
MGDIAKVLAALAEHADVISDVVSALAAGTPKEAIRAALRAAKKQVSDDAFREELGLAPESIAP